MTNPEEARQCALLRINDVREWAGLDKLVDLPKGRMSDPCECPVARALAGTGCSDVSTRCITLLSDTDADAFARKIGGQGVALASANCVVPPADLAAFITNFDFGEYPDLIEEN